MQKYEIIEENYMEVGKYMENQLKCMELYIKWLGMVGKWLGCIQPMCSAPGHSWQGPFFSQSRPLFLNSAFFVFL